MAYTQTEVRAEIARRKYNKSHNTYKAAKNAELFGLSKTQLAEALASFTKTETTKVVKVAVKQVKTAQVQNAKQIAKANKAFAKAKAKGGVKAGFRAYKAVVQG